jgi:hypothetical protein
LSAAIAKEAVVADALEAAWQDVDQETANEFVSRQRHRPVAIVAAIVFPAEAHLAVVDGQQGLWQGFGRNPHTERR